MIWAPGAASLGSYYKPELKFQIHSDKWAKRGGTETSALPAERGKRPDQWQHRPQGSEPNGSQPGDKSGARSPRLNSLSSWWTFSWPASSEMCHRGVRVINRSGYTPERGRPHPTLPQIGSGRIHPPTQTERLLAQTELGLLCFGDLSEIRLKFAQQ